MANLRQELDKRMSRVNAGKLIEHSDIARAVFELCETVKDQIKTARNTANDVSPYRSGFWAGMEKGADDIQNWLLGQIKDGDRAREAIEKDNLTKNQVKAREREQSEATALFDKLATIREQA